MGKACGATGMGLRPALPWPREHRSSFGSLSARQSGKEPDSNRGARQEQAREARPPGLEVRT
eukprot:13485539-Alexandrium_andersonii.AAC.1